MAEYKKFQPFIGKAFNGLINLQTDECSVALTENLPLATYSTLSQITPISYEFLPAPDRVLQGQTSVETGGIYKFGVEDLTLTAQGGPVGPFQYVVIYDSGNGDDSLICWFEYPELITLQNTETLTLNFSEQNGLFSAV